MTDATSRLPNIGLECPPGWKGNQPGGSFMTDCQGRRAQRRAPGLERGLGAPPWRERTGVKFVVCAMLVALAVPAQAAERLPKSMLGKWATDLAACPEQVSEIRITVEPREVRFHEQTHVFRRVVRLKDGSFRGTGFSYDLDGRGKTSLTLKLLDADRLQVGEEVFLRCQIAKPVDGMAKGNRPADGKPKDGKPK